MNDLKKLTIPIPPLPQQEAIAYVLDHFDTLANDLSEGLPAEITLRQKQYEYYRDLLLDFTDKNGDLRERERVIKIIDKVVRRLETEESKKYADIFLSMLPKVKWMSLGEVFDIIAGGDVPKESYSERKTNEYKIPILSNGIAEKSLYGWTNISKVDKPSLTISARGTIGWTSYRDYPFFPIVRLIVLTPQIEINLRYAYYYMKTIENQYKVPPTGIPQLTKPMIKDIKIPIPSLEEQQRIVAILDKFDALTHSISEGLPREIQLRRKQYEYYRNQLLSF